GPGERGAAGQRGGRPGFHTVQPVRAGQRPARRGTQGLSNQIIPVRVRPGASRTRVGGRYEGPHGPALVVAVTAPPVEGRATEAVRRAVADALGLRTRDVTLRAGTTGRDKLLAVADPGPDLAARLAALRDTKP